jgi:hypothetical protein
MLPDIVTNKKVENIIKVNIVISFLNPKYLIYLTIGLKSNSENII